MTDFKKELCELLNKYSKENESDTPDFILAEYLIGSLKIFCESVNHRNTFYVRMEEPENEPQPTDIEKANDIIENLLDAIPKQTNDADWREDDLTNAVHNAKTWLSETSKQQHGV